MTFWFQSKDTKREAIFRDLFAQELPDLDIVTEPADPADVTYMFSWAPPADLTVYPNLKVMFSVSAGVDQFTHLPPHVPLIRMVDPNNQRRVAEWVTMTSLACARHIPRYAAQQQGEVWKPLGDRLASQMTVGILGLGDIGQQAATLLRAMGFAVEGWSRSPKDLPGIRSHSGPQGLSAVLAAADVVVCLLPLTEATRGLMDASFFSAMKPGAAVVQAGRGAQCDLAALREALASGQVGQAFLDVTDPEPLPPGHWAWNMPNCLVTPHVAGRLDHEQGARNVITNIRRHRAGAPLLWQVDRQAGY